MVPSVNNETSWQQRNVRSNCGSQQPTALTVRFGGKCYDLEGQFAFANAETHQQHIQHTDGDL